MLIMARSMLVISSFQQMTVNYVSMLHLLYFFHAKSSHFAMIGKSFPGAMNLESHQDHLGRVSIYLIDVYNHLTHSPNPILWHISRIWISFLARCPWGNPGPMYHYTSIFFVSPISEPCSSRSQLLDSEYRLTQPDVLKTVPTPTVSLEHEFFLKELFFYRYSGIASETTLLIRFRLVMRFRRTLQDPGLSMYKWDNPSFTFKQCLQAYLV
ncbi:hypothetical protein L1887_02078 [Cichorium endivia]|nr:hypothetical protein L1887_02078 [Cichorium endivia]